MNKSQESQYTLAKSIIDGDIGILLNQKRLKEDTSIRKKILTEKINMLYIMDILTPELYYSYMEIIITL